MGYGSFDSICNKTALPLCSVIGHVSGAGNITDGTIPQCYARPVELANTMIFQVGNACIHIGGLIVMLLIVFNVRLKYTAIGRKEMLFFFYTIIALIVSSLVVDCGVSPPNSSSYPYFVAVQLAIASACCSSLLFNGIVCFQFWEDGSRRSMFALRAISFIWFAITFVIAIVTFKSWNTSLGNGKTTALFTVSYVINAILVAAYAISQVVLVIFALRSYWGLGAICLGSFFFIAGQILTYVFSYDICNSASHYIDGVFFGSVCNIFTVMMIYKFWDMITTDDLEFSVANVEQGVMFGNEDEKRSSTFFT